MLGWPLRTFEYAVQPDKLGWARANFAFTSWKVLSWADGNVWRRLVPKGWFYNVEITGVNRPDIRSRRCRLPDVGPGFGCAVRGRNLSFNRPRRRHQRLREQFGDRTPVLVETVLLRRRAAAKLSELPSSHNWLFTDEALQQASAAPVALHRSKRSAARSFTT